MNDLFPPVEQRERIAVPALEVTVALSLTQPWATLMELMVKLNETRSWPTRYRGWIGIQASKGFPKECRELAATSPFATVLYGAGYRSWKDLPTGCLLGVTRVLDCVRTEGIRDGLGELERAFGDYSNGRFAWRTAGFRKLREPIPMKGALSIWKMPRAITEADLV